VDPECLADVIKGVDHGSIVAMPKAWEASLEPQPAQPEPLELEAKSQPLGGADKAKGSPALKEITNDDASSKAAIYQFVPAASPKSHKALPPWWVGQMAAYAKESGVSLKVESDIKLVQDWIQEHQKTSQTLDWIKVNAPDRVLSVFSPCALSFYVFF